MVWKETDTSTEAGSGSTIKCAQGALLTPTAGAITVTDSFHSINGGTLETISGGTANSLYVFEATSTFGVSGAGNVQSPRLTVNTGDIIALWFDGSAFIDLYSAAFTDISGVLGDAQTPLNLLLSDATASVGRITRNGVLHQHNFAPNGSTNRNTFLGNSAGNTAAITGYTSISGATNANPIVITTSVPHGIFPGATSVTIDQVAGNTAANGTWTPTVVSATTFSIPVAGNGTYTSSTGRVFFAYSGSDNTGIGSLALTALTSGNSNTAVGMNAMASNTSGYVNNALGVSALATNTTGYENVAIGNNALTLNTSGHSNTAVGVTTLIDNTTGNFNTACGVDALSNQTTPSSNTGMGASALATNTTGANNTAVGAAALSLLNGAVSNTAIGNNAGVTANSANANVTGDKNTYLGANTGAADTGQYHSSTAVGYNAQFGANNVLILGGMGADGVNVGIGTTAPKSKLDIVGLPVYANNAAAITGGLAAGSLYRTGADPDPVCVVH